MVNSRAHLLDPATRCDYEHVHIGATMYVSFTSLDPLCHEPTSWPRWRGFYKGDCMPTTAPRSEDGFVKVIEPLG
jgi:hypothetical protein